MELNIEKSHEKNIDNILFLDFETDKKGIFFCATYKLGSTFKQVILNEDLRPFAVEKGLECMEPLEFMIKIKKLVKNCILAAYSEAELSTIKNVLSSANIIVPSIRYCNMRIAAKKYINSNPVRKKEFEGLPPFLKKADNYQKRKMRWSLASVARLFPVEIPKAYHPGQTSQRFKYTINALQKKQGDYSKLTITQKSKVTKALNHNWFDVEVLPVMYTKIFEENSKHIDRSIKLIE